MSACSIHVPPLRHVPSLHKNESMKTEKKREKNSYSTLLAVIMCSIWPSSLNFEDQGER